ncbi:MAG: IclR family transcriptional regulator [Ruegeria sp.]
MNVGSVNMSDQTTAARRGRPRRQKTDDSANLSPVVALDRGIRVLSLLADLHQATLSEIAKETGVPAATVHRILTTLQQRGMVVQDGRNGSWRVGPHAYRIGNAFQPGSNLLEVAPPVMRALSKETGETTNLAIEDGGALLYLIQVESENPIRASIKNGTAAYFHTSGVGKILMAYMDSSKLDELLGTFKLERQTPNSITNEDLLKTELSNCKRQGWAMDDEERFLGMRCIAAPVFDAFGNVIAGVSISGPTTRFPDEKLEPLAQRVIHAATQIYESLRKTPGE